MATHDYNLANQSGADFRADLNNVLQAVLTLNSSATEPATTAAYMLWLDTANSVLKIRNGADNAWVVLPLSITADNTVDINGGTIDGISQLTLGSSTSVNSILDEDNLNSDSPTALATQQSIKAYVDSQVTAQDLDFQGDSGGVLSIDLDSEVFTLNGGTGIDTTGSENTISFAIDSTVVTLTGVQVLTNKTIDADDNTISNLEVDNLKSGVLDTDLNAVSASDDTLASAKAIKTYVDANITAQDLDVSDGTTSIAIDLDSETLSLLGGTGVSSTASGNGVTFAIGQSVGTTDDVTFNTVTGNLTGQVSDISNHTTSDLTEGTNLYYTTARFDSRLATKDTDDLSEGSNLYYTQARFDSAFTAKSTSDLSEGTNLYYTDARFDTRFDTRLATKDTDDLTEGSNLYYTQARFDSAFTAKSTSDLSEGTNLYYTDARWDTKLAAADTDNLSEGTSNLYYTDARANSAIDARVTKSFVDALNIQAASVDANSVALGTDTTGNYIQTITGTANKITVTGSGSESADVTLTLPDDVQIADSLTVAGNLTVNGTLAYLNTTNLDITDNLFQLNAGLTGSPVNDSGMLINRGNQDNGIFMWDESADKFTLGLTTADGSATGNITLNSLGTLVANIEGNITGNVTGTVSDISNHSTSDLTEGSNLYYTDARADARVNLQTGANLDLSSKSTSDLSEGTNEYFTTARARSSISASGDLSYNSSTGVISFTASAAPVTSVNTQTGAVVLDSDDIAEGSTNLYYTDARARAAISESSTQLAYNSTTGVLTYTQGDTDTVSEGSSNLYYTSARFNSAFSGKSTSDLSEGTNLYYTDARFDTRLAAKDTDDVSEGSSNLYYTDARSRAAVSVSGDLAYNSSTGVFSFTERTDAEVQALITAGTGVAVSSGVVSIGQAVATSDSPTFANMTLNGTGSIKVPSGTTAQRDGSPANGMFRYNSEDAQFEGYADGAWGAIAGSGGGASAMETNNFTGDGSTTAFTLSSSVSDEDNLLAFIEGVYQNKADFVASGTTITFDTAPAAGRNIVVHHVKASISGSNVILNSYTGDGSDTTFTLSVAPQSENNTQVHLDGVYQNKSTYTVSGTTLTFDAAPANGVAIEVIMFTQTTINEPAANTVGITQLNVSDGTNGQVLTTNGSGTLSFADGGVAGITSSADATAITIDSSENTSLLGDLILNTAGADVSADDVFGRIDFYDQDGGSSAAGTTSRIESVAVGNVGASKLTFSTSTSGGGARSSLTEKMAIDESGNVAIATTTTFSNPLTLNKAAGAAGSLNNQIALTHTGASTAYHIKTIRAAATDEPAGLAFVENTTERMRINSSGNVGINDTAPAGQLEVRNTTNQPTGIFAHEANNLGGYTDIMSSSTFTANSVNHQYFVCKSGNGSAISDIEFNLRGDGNAYADGSWNGGGADYAEYFEWSDGNTDNEDRVGHTVSLINNKIKIAEAGETVIGVISGNPSVVGDDAWNSWANKYLKDDYGRYLRDENGHRTPNPDYDDTLTYVKREDRPEWDIVGLMGKLRIKTGQQTNPSWIKMRDISDSVEEWLVK